MPQLSMLQRPVPTSRVLADLADSDEGSNNHHFGAKIQNSMIGMDQQQHLPLTDIVVLVPHHDTESLASSSVGHSSSSSTLQQQSRRRRPRRTSRCDVTLASDESSKDTLPTMPRKGGGLPQEQQQGDEQQQNNDSFSSGCSSPSDKQPRQPRRQSRCDKTLCRYLSEFDISPKVPTRKDSHTDLANNFFAACRASLAASEGDGCCFSPQPPSPSMNLFRFPDIGYDIEGSNNEASNQLEPESIMTLLDEVEQIISIDIYSG